MLAEDFIVRKRRSWERLDRLTSRARNGLTGFSAEDVQEFGRLYRQVTSDLAVARRDFPDHPVAAYLNDLAFRTHGQIYRSKSTHLGQLFFFFTHTFPRTFRETWSYTLAAFLMFLLPALVCFIIAYRDTGAMLQVFPAYEDIINDIRAGHEWWKHINEEGRAFSSSFIMTNNIRVAFIAFAGGVFFGTLSLYVLAQNGIMLGTVAGAAQQFDFADNLWGFIAAHGVIELSVIFIAGGAGIQLGWSILRPGLHTRGAALRKASHRAVQLLFGCVPLLVIAGIIEGFISPSDLPVGFKLCVSAASGLLLYSYLFRSGKRHQKNEASG